MNYYRPYRGRYILYLRGLRIWLAVCVVILLLFPVGAYAEVATGSSMSSDNFRVLDSQHGGFGGTASSSSTSFGLIGTIGDIAIGSSSITTFGLRSGFLYYPKVIAPTLTAPTAGDAQVDLTWLAAETFQGWSVGGYNACTKPGAGSYTCVNVGNVTSYTKTGLTNGTTYTFKIEVKDALDSVIATSNEQSATPVSVAPTPTPTPVPGGGGGGGYPWPATTVVLDGWAYPRAEVVILRDAQPVGSIRAEANGHFNFSDSAVPYATYRYSLFATDSDARRSVMISFLAQTRSGANTIGGIIIPPTVELSARQVSAGTPVTARGQATPGVLVIADMLPDGIRLQTSVGGDGSWSIEFSTKGLSRGVRTIRAKTRLASGAESIFSDPLGLGVDVPFKEKEFNVPKCGKIRQPDLNCDRAVNIIDLSIMAYWYKRSITADFYVDLSMDGTIDLIDFSIMAFYWTG